MIYFSFGALPIGRGPKSEIPSSKIKLILPLYINKLVIGFSSMTSYSYIVHNIIAEIRKINPKAFIVWGGIHPIIHPEDAIKHADAVCTGEGEFAFKNFLEMFRNGEDYTTASSFWFKKGTDDIRNSPILYVIKNLLEESMFIKVYEKFNPSDLIGNNKNHIKKIK